MMRTISGDGVEIESQMLLLLRLYLNLGTMIAVIIIKRQQFSGFLFYWCFRITKCNQKTKKLAKIAKIRANH